MRQKIFELEQGGFRRRLRFCRALMERTGIAHGVGPRHAAQVASLRPLCSSGGNMAEDRPVRNHWGGIWLGDRVLTLAAAAFSALHGEERAGCCPCASRTMAAGLTSAAALDRDELVAGAAVAVCAVRRHRAGD